MNATDKSTLTVEEPVDSKKDMLNCVLKDFEAARSAREEYEADWDAYFDKYMCHLRSGKYPWRSKVFDPETYAAIETIHPRILNTIFGAPEVFGVKPTNQEDVELAQNTEKLLNYQADRMDCYQVSGEIIKDALIYGTGHGKLYWAREFEPRYKEDETIEQVINEETGLPEFQLKLTPKKEFVLVYDNPRLDRVDPKAIYVDPLACGVDDARFIVHRFHRTLDHLKKKELEGFYKNVADIPAQTNAGDTSDSRDTTTKSTSRETVEFSKPGLADVELLEYWGKYDIDDCGYMEECCITVANRKTIIRADYNKFPGGQKPFIRFTPVPIPGKYWGLSVIAPISDIQDALNDRTNQVADNINLLINPMYLKSRWADIDEDQLVSRPSGFIDVDDINNSIKRLDTGDVIGSVFPEIGRLEGKIQKALGTYDVAVGAMPARQETATTTISLQNVAEIRFKTMAILFERMFIRPLGNMMIKLDKAYMGRNRQVRVMGNDFMLGGQEQFISIGPEDIVENPDVYAVGAALEVGASKEMQLNNIMKFLSIVSNPVFQQSPLYSVDYGVILERIPYLLNIKLKGPIVTDGNPQLAYAEMQQEKQLADQMLGQQMSGDMQMQNQMKMAQMQMAMQPPGPPPPGAPPMPEEEDENSDLPPRVQGELNQAQEEA